MSTKQSEDVSGQQSGQSSRGIFSLLVVLLLMVIIGLQLWYMFDIKKQLDSIEDEYDSLQALVNGNATSSEQGPAPVIATDEASHDDAEPPQMSSVDDNIALDNQAASANADPASSSPHDTQQSRRQPPVGQPRQRNINPYYPPYRAYPQPYPGPYSGPNWDPYEDIRRMHQEMREKMERAFDDRRYDFPYDSPGRDSQQQQNSFEYHFRENLSSPKMKVQENDQQYFISVNIPGADENDVSVRLEGQYLTIVGKQKSQQQQSDPDGQFTFSQRRSGKFQRSITLREPVDERGLRTRIDNGVLTIVIPKLKF